MFLESDGSGFDIRLDCSEVAERSSGCESRFDLLHSTNCEMEDEMENALMATQLLFNVMGGLGIFFLGVGVLWFVSVYKDKEK